MRSGNTPFYESGLHFSCTRCSMCCRFDSGYVWLSERDVSRLAAGLKISKREVIRSYCSLVKIGGFRQVSLAEQENKDCIFWVDGACSVYTHRPLQCRSFPFWSPFLTSRSDWDALEAICPGVNIGKLHSSTEIEEWLSARRWEIPLDAQAVEGWERDES